MTLVPDADEVIAYVRRRAVDAEAAADACRPGPFGNDRHGLYACAAREQAIADQLVELKRIADDRRAEAQGPGLIILRPPE